MKRLVCFKILSFYFIFSISINAAEVCPENKNGWGLTDKEIEKVHKTVYKSHIDFKNHGARLKRTVVANHNPMLSMLQSFCGVRIFGRHSSSSLEKIYPQDAVEIPQDPIEIEKNHRIFYRKRTKSAVQNDSIALVPWSSVHYSGWEVKGLTDYFRKYGFKPSHVLGGEEEDWKYKNFNPRPVEYIDENSDTINYRIYKLYYEEKNIRGKIGVNVEDASDILFFSGPFVPVKYYSDWIVNQLGKKPFPPLKLSLEDKYHDLIDQGELSDTISFEKFLGSRAYAELLYWNFIAFEEENVRLSFSHYEEGYLIFEANLTYLENGVSGYPRCLTSHRNEAKKCSNYWQFYKLVKCNLHRLELRNFVDRDRRESFYFISELKIKIDPHSGEVLFSAEKDKNLGSLPQCR